MSAPIDPSRVNVSFIPSDGTAPLRLLVNGEPEVVDEDRALEIISKEDVEIKVELGMGPESAKYWTCDFSYVSVVVSRSIRTCSNVLQEYVRINGEYRS